MAQVTGVEVWSIYRLDNRRLGAMQGEKPQENDLFDRIEAAKIICSVHTAEHRTESAELARETSV